MELWLILILQFPESTDRGYWLRFCIQTSNNNYIQKTISKNTHTKAEFLNSELLPLQKSRHINFVRNNTTEYARLYDPAVTILSCNEFQQSSAQLQRELNSWLTGKRCLLILKLQALSMLLSTSNWACSRTHYSRHPSTHFRLSSMFEAFIRSLISCNMWAPCSSLSMFGSSLGQGSFEVDEWLKYPMMTPIPIPTAAMSNPEMIKQRLFLFCFLGSLTPNDSVLPSMALQHPRLGFLWAGRGHYKIYRKIQNISKNPMICLYECYSYIFRVWCIPQVWNNLKGILSYHINTYTNVWSCLQMASLSILQSHQSLAYIPSLFWFTSW